ncbi:MAG: esterase-like activity of phytase family protein [Geminicoccaceae bacterium]
MGLTTALSADRADDGDGASQAVVVSAERYGDVPKAVRDALGDRLTVEAVFDLTSDHPLFGGLSGLWVAPGGDHLITISDNGQRWEAHLRHGDDGRLAGLEDWTVADLPRRPEDGEGGDWQDAESLSGDGLDGLIVAYEGEHRLRRWPLDDLMSVPEDVTLPDGLGGPSNSGIEALSTLPGGRLFAVGERVGAWGGEGLMGWVIEAEGADDLVYIQGPGFAPTGADRLDDQVYVVERSFSLFGGFRSRIVTFPADAARPGARVEGTELAAFRWGDLGENFEGISARRGPDGRILLYLLADDNFSFFQDTLLVQLSLSPESLTD